LSQAPHGPQGSHFPANKPLNKLFTPRRGLSNRRPNFWPHPWSASHGLQPLSPASSHGPQLASQGPQGSEQPPLHRPASLKPSKNFRSESREPLPLSHEPASSQGLPQSATSQGLHSAAPHGSHPLEANMPRRRFPNEVLRQEEAQPSSPHAPHGSQAASSQGEQATTPSHGPLPVSLQGLQAANFFRPENRSQDLARQALQGSQAGSHALQSAAYARAPSKRVATRAVMISLGRLSFSWLVRKRRNAHVFFGDSAGLERLTPSATQTPRLSQRPYSFRNTLVICVSPDGPTLGPNLFRIGF